MKIVYWTGTGNTQKMAEALAAGIQEAGSEAELLFPTQIDAATLLAEDAFALGCPSMGAEELEETEMEPFMAELESGLSGKKVALFGSYGWGDGEWMRNWEERVRAAGAMLVNDGVIANGEPSDDEVEQLKALGKMLL